MTIDRGPDPRGQSVTEYLGVFWRRKWLIVLVVAIATVGGYVFSAVQTKHYQAQTQLIYSSQVDVANPLGNNSYNDAQSRTVDLQSVGTLLGSPDMTGRAEAELARQGFSSLPDYEVTAEVQSNTQLVQGQTDVYASVVSVYGDSTDPQFAAAVANAYAKVFIEWRAEQQKARLSRAIEVVGDQLEAMTSPSEKLSSDYILLQQRLHDLQISRASADGNFRVIVPAEAPEKPYAPQPFKTALIAFGVGLIFAIALAFVLDQFDTRLRNDSDVAAVLRQPILGRIPRISAGALQKSPLVALSDPEGHAADSFRLLRTNLDFMNVDGQVRSLLVTSCLQGEGKSVAVANLAATLALNGKKVVVVDADLRRPRMHTYFGLQNDVGVSTVGTGQGSLDDAMQAVATTPGGGDDAHAEPAAGLSYRKWAAGDEARGRLFVLTSGPLPPNPGEIVASKTLGGIIETLARDADVVVVDSPAMLAVGDTQALADKVDGLAFLVDPNVVRAPQLDQARERLERMPCRLLGVIVARRKSTAHSYRYYYYDGADGGGQSRRRSRTTASV